LDGSARGLALVALAYQWPDDRTKALARRHEKSSEKALAEHASRVLQRLSALPTKGSAKPAGSGAGPSAADSRAAN
jgi:hypothetical protein